MPKLEKRLAIIFAYKPAIKNTNKKAIPQSNSLMTPDRLEPKSITSLMKNFYNLEMHFPHP